MFHLRSTCLVVGLVAASAALHGQEQATVYLSVIDRKGAPVLEVEASDVAISEESGRSTIQSVRRFSWPLKVTVLVDNGPSTGDALDEGLARFSDALVEYADRLKEEFRNVNREQLQPYLPVLVSIASTHADGSLVRRQDLVKMIAVLRKHRVWTNM